MQEQAGSYNKEGANSHHSTHSKSTPIEASNKIESDDKGFLMGKSSLGKQNEHGGLVALEEIKEDVNESLIDETRDLMK